MTVKAIGITPVDQQLLDAQKFSRIQIASLFPVPPHLIGETEKTATYASVEQFGIFYVVHCLLPRVIMWEQAIQRDLITSDRYFVKFSMAALLRGDTAARFAAYKVAIENGWMNPDEVRVLEDLNPIPGGAGRRYWRPANWLPLEQSNAPALPVPENQQPNDTDTADPADDGGEGSNDDGSAQATVLRLQVLAGSAADRCVRKEVAALRKMGRRGATGYQLEEFYAEQLDFVAEVLQLDPEQRTELRQIYFDRATALAASIAGRFAADIERFVERLAAEEPRRLAQLAVKGAAA